MGNLLAYGTNVIGNVSGGLSVSITAAQVAYNNTVTELTATNVQAAIDEIASSGGGGLLPRLYIHSDTGATTVRAVKGTTTIPATETSTSGLFSCDVPEYGDWTVYGVVDSTSMQTNITVNAVKEYEINFINGSTVTPVDDVQILLQCAAIYDASEIETISDLLADTTILSTVINSNNAMNYMVRSTSWVGAITTNETAMSYIGLDNYASNVLIMDSTWNTAIQNSNYYESIDNSKVPVLTSNTANVIYDSQNTSSGYHAYKAFDNNSSTYAAPGVGTSSQSFGYLFNTPMKICKVTLNLYVWVSGDNAPATSFVLQGSNDGSSWTNIVTVGSSEKVKSTTTYNWSKIITPTVAYNRYRIRGFASYSGEYTFRTGTIQFWGREDY